MVLYRFCHILFRFFFMLFCRWEVKGAENLPLQGPVLVIANHSSYWDPLVIACALDREVHFMAKRELFNYPVFGYLIRKVGAFPVAREKIDRAALKRALTLLKEEKVVGIFPEGTRSKTGELLTPLPGAAFIARKAHAPVCPIALRRKKRIFGNSIFPCYHVQIGEVFSLDPTEKRDLQADADQMLIKIKELLEESL